MLHAAVESYILNRKWNGPELTLDQKAAVEDAIAYFHKLEQALSGEPGYKLHVEDRVFLKEYHPSLFECSGTCDILIETDKELHVLDWKFGQGIPVYAEDNDQLYAYAAGAAVNPERARGYEKIVIHCIQPRLESYDTVELTPKQLMQWMNGRLIPGCTEALSDSPSFNPGQKQCRWCPAKMKCRARHNMANKTAADVFKAATGLPDAVTQQELTGIYVRAKELEQYIKDIGAHIFQTIQAGESWPGYKVVAGRSIRRWKHDQQETVESLSSFLDWDLLFTQKLITPAQAEKLDRDMKKDPRFQELIEKPEGKPALAHESDKRPPLEFRTAADIFSGMIAAIDAVEGINNITNTENR